MGAYRFNSKSNTRVDPFVTPDTVDDLRQSLGSPQSSIVTG